MGSFPWRFISKILCSCYMQYTCRFFFSLLARKCLLSLIMFEGKFNYNLLFSYCCCCHLRQFDIEFLFCFYLIHKHLFVYVLNIIALFAFVVVGFVKLSIVLFIPQFLLVERMYVRMYIRTFSFALWVWVWVKMFVLVKVFSFFSLLCLLLLFLFLYLLFISRCFVVAAIQSSSSQQLCLPQDKLVISVWALCI